jgi:hypothetical protein
LIVDAINAEKMRTASLKRDKNILQAIWPDANGGNTK